MNFTIGIIDYLNTQPFQYDLEERLRPLGVNFRRGVPTALNQALLAGEIDLAPISAVFAAQHAGEFAILPGHSIASLGAVRTVLLFSWRPDIRELDGQTIVLTEESATSIALLKALCRERYRIASQYVVRPPHLPTMMQEGAAALLIGDAALVEGSLHRELTRDAFSYGRPTIFDLGDEWLKLTGRPFVFALWAVRRDSVEALRQLGVAEALAASKAAGLAHLEEIAAAYAPSLALPAGVCLRYLRDLRYDLTDNDRQGLVTFLKMVLPDFAPDDLSFLVEG
ncbi:MAG: menaquinone biosynthesis protein [Chloroflexota bacterium]